MGVCKAENNWYSNWYQKIIKSWGLYLSEKGHRQLILCMWLYQYECVILERTDCRLYHENRGLILFWFGLSRKLKFNLKKHMIKWQNSAHFILVIFFAVLCTDCMVLLIKKFITFISTWICNLFCVQSLLTLEWHMTKRLGFRNMTGLDAFGWLQRTYLGLYF